MTSIVRLSDLGLGDDGRLILDDATLNELVEQAVYVTAAGDGENNHSCSNFQSCNGSSNFQSCTNTQGQCSGSKNSFLSCQTTQQEIE